MSTIFQEIRDAAELVSSQARWVAINFNKLMVYPELLQIERTEPLRHSPDQHLLDRGEDTLVFFLILDTINFGSGYFPFVDKDNSLSGYFTMAGRLKSYIEAYGIPSPSTLSALSANDCAHIFRQRLDNLHAQELMFFFATALNQLGSWVGSRWRGDYLGLLRSSRSAEEVLNYLCELSYFRDIGYYGLIRIPMLKRAQIFLHDINIAVADHPLTRFPDLNDLTIFADNLIPYVLRSDGILECDPWLSTRIECEQLIGAGSCEEIELRACSIHAAETLAALLNDAVGPITARELDYHLWNRGQRLKNSSTLKPHRTRTVYY